MHPWGKWGRPFTEYGVVAARAALADAGIDWQAVDLVVGGETVRNGYAGYVAGATFAQALGWNGARVATSYAACATGAQALDTARARILAGLSEVALVVGADTTPKGFLAPNAGERWDDPDWLRFRLLGMTNPAYFALYARRRMDLYGATPEDFAAVKVKNARHGLENPNARYRKEVSVDDVLTSAVVSDPLHLLDICATSDGAAAVVVASTEYAKKLGLDRPVRVSAVSHGDADVPQHGHGHAQHLDRLQGRARRRAGADLQGVDRARGLRGGRDLARGRQPGRGLRPLHRARAGLDGGPRPLQARRGRGRCCGPARPRSAAGSRSTRPAGWPASARRCRRRRWPRCAR